MNGDAGVCVCPWHVGVALVDATSASLRRNRTLLCPPPDQHVNIHDNVSKPVRLSVFFQIFTTKRFTSMILSRSVSSAEVLSISLPHNIIISSAIQLWRQCSLPRSGTEPLMGWEMSTFNLPFAAYYDRIKLSAQTEQLLLIFYMYFKVGANYLKGKVAPQQQKWIYFQLVPVSFCCMHGSISPLTSCLSTTL